MSISSKTLIFIVMLLSIESSEATKLRVDYNKTLSNFWGDQSKPTHIFRPSTIVELQDVIRENFRNKRKYRIVGSLHANNDSAFSKYSNIILKGIPEKFDFNEERKTVRVSSWSTLIEVNKSLAKLGRTLHGTPSHGYQTIGGSVATGSHNEGDEPLLSDHIVSITVILPDGRSIIITDSKLLRYYRVSFGLLGTIVEVELKTYPAKDYIVVNKYMNLENIDVKMVENWMNNYDRFFIDFFPYNKIANINLWDSVEGKAPQHIVNQSWRGQSSFFYRLFTRLIAGDFFLRDALLDTFMNFVLKYRLNLNNEVFVNHDPRILLNNFPFPDQGNEWFLKSLIDTSSSIYDFEISIPLENFFNVSRFLVKEITEMRKRDHIVMVEPLLFRFGKKSDKHVLGMNSFQDCVFITLPIPKNGLELFKSIILEIVNSYGGRIHLGKQIFNFDHNVLFRNYSRADILEFFSYRKHIDKHDLLVNDYAKQLLPVFLNRVKDENK